MPSFIDVDTTLTISIQCANSLIKPYNQKITQLI